MRRRFISAWRPRRLQGLAALLLGLVLTTLLPFVALSAYHVYNRRQSDAASVTAQTQAVAAVLADEHIRTISDARTLLATVAQYASSALSSPAGLSSEACTRYLSDLMRQASTGLYLNILFATPSGDVTCSAVPPTGPLNIGDRSYFKTAMAARTFAVGEWTVGRVTGRYTLPVGYPVIDQRGGIQGVAIAALDPGVLLSVAKEATLPEGTVVSLIDDTGVIRAQYPESPESIGQTSPVFEALGRRAHLEGSASGAAVGWDGVPRLYTLHHELLDFEGAADSVAIGVPTAIAFAGADRLLARSVIVLVVVIVGVLSATYLGARRWLLEPLALLTQATDRFGSGDLGARVGVHYLPHELRMLGQSFDTMAAALEEHEARLSTANADLEQQVMGRTAALEVASAGERAAREEADRANQAKSDFLAQMSHELRTPMNAIMGFTELLAERANDRLEPRERQYITHVQKAGQHLLDLINDVLDLARVDAGRTDFVIETIELDAVLGSLIASTQLAATEQGVAFQAEFAPAVVVSLDPGRTRQILLNLLSNAVKFTPSGGRVTLQVVPEGPDLVIRVSDTGIGIPADRQDRVFGAFERLHDDLVAISGTGIGLAITKRLVELQHGEISFESAEGVGTTFQVRLSGVVRGRTEGPRLLVLEDDAVDAELIVERASEVGLDVQVVTTVGAALEAVRQGPPTAVVLDLRLRGERGETFLEQLKRDPTTAHVPVLVLSIEDDTGRSRALGADDHLVKAIDRDRLVRWLQRVATPLEDTNADPAR